MSHPHHSPGRRIGRAGGHHVHLPTPRQLHTLRPGCRDRESQTIGNRYSVTCFTSQVAAKILTERDRASIGVDQSGSAFTVACPPRWPRLQPCPECRNHRPRRDPNEKGLHRKGSETSPVEPWCVGNRDRCQHTEQGRRRSCARPTSPGAILSGLGREHGDAIDPTTRNRSQCSGHSGHTALLSIRVRHRRLLYTKNSLYSNANPSAWTCFRGTKLPKGVFSRAPPSPVSHVRRSG